jgi:23S rRNA (uracil1939-C5)-methyltransferase
MLTKNQQDTVTIESCTVEGYGVCRLDGRAVFVSGALPGESWEIRILKVTNTAVWAKGLRLLEASADRIANTCPNPCGGCSLRHLDYPAELAIKKRHVDDCLRRLGGQEKETDCIHPSPVIDRCRNKAVFAVGELDGTAVFGFYRPRSHDLIPVADCLLQSERCLQAAMAVTDFMNHEGISAYCEESGKGTVRHIFWRESDRDAVLCITAARGFGSRTEALVEFLRAACPFLTGIVLNINKSRLNTVLAGEFYTLWGCETVRQRFCGVDFAVHPQAFLQVNPLQAEAIYRKVLEWAIPEGTELEVLDLYCGAGTISLCLAKTAGHVIGVEIVPEAVENAKKSAMQNGIPNADFFCADSSDLAKLGLHTDAAVVDPPRKGLDERVVTDLAALAPERIVYVSCNPATLARDLKRFEEQGYTLQCAEAYDMFPRTAHVETVVLLSRV